MLIASLILAYIIGCVLSYGRVYASFYELEEKYCTTQFPEITKQTKILFVYISILSWVGFLIGLVFFLFLKNEKYLFKFSINDLVEKYNRSNK